MTKKQIEAIQYLIEGNSAKDTADFIGVERHTISRWLRDSKFKEEYKRCLESVMLELCGEAKETLLDLMRNSNSDTVKMNCAKDILNRVGLTAVNEVVKDENGTINIVIS